MQLRLAILRLVSKVKVSVERLTLFVENRSSSRFARLNQRKFRKFFHERNEIERLEKRVTLNVDYVEKLMREFEV